MPAPARPVCDGQGIEQGRIRAYQDQMMRQGRCAIYGGQIVCQWGL